MILVQTETGNMPTIKRILLPFILFLLVSSGVFSQSVTKKAATATLVSITTGTAAVQVIALDDNHQVDFVIWFMGSIQSPNSETSSSSDNTATSRKKQCMSSGTLPNKVLYRTFVKKVYSQEHAIV